MNNSSKITRAFYIIIVPIVLLIVLLNSGWLQRWFTAVTLDGVDYSAVEYNYYYFRAYRGFVDSEEFAQSGLNLNGSLSGQVYEGEVSWKEHFQAQAEEQLVRVAYYDGLAGQAGYEFAPEELAPAQAELEEIAAFCAETGISESNYYSAYYGAGMTREVFAQELERETRAEAYRAYLAQGLDVTAEEIDGWLAENQAEEHPLAQLYIVQLDAVPDRAEGQVGAAELADLEGRLARLEERFGQGELSMAELCARYSDEVWGQDGLVSGADVGDLPDVVAAWCFAGERAAGDWAALFDGEKGRGYLVRLEGLSGSSAEKTARLALAAQALEGAEAAALESAGLEYHTIGMQLATT